MFFYDVVQVDIADDVAVGQNNVFFLAFIYEGCDVFQRFEACCVEEVFCVCKGCYVRREYLYAAGTTCKIPVDTGAKVIHKGLIVIMRYYSDVLDAAVHHIRKGEIYQAVSASERYACHGSEPCQLGDAFIVDVRENNSYNGHLSDVPFVLILHRRGGKFFDCRFVGVGFVGYHAAVGDVQTAADKSYAP